jgi:SAM-dependent methyltransferase
VLDYGCGWGRLARMMAYYTDPANIWCVDPLKDSVNICKDDGVLGNIRLSEYHPTELPVGAAQFDLAYAYSVFTHTSKRATTMALNTVRRYMKPDGLFVITVRPVEIWGLAEFGENAEANRAELIAEFDRTGFSFLENPHMRIDGESVYGVTAIAPEWITRTFPNWRIVRRDRGEDHSQHILVLQPC